jgi:cytochrome P450
MSLLQSSLKLVAFAQKQQADLLKAAEDLAAALADDVADQAAVDAATAKVAELQAIVDSGIGLDSSDEEALALSIEALIAPVAPIA